MEKFIPVAIVSFFVLLLGGVLLATKDPVYASAGSLASLEQTMSELQRDTNNNQVALPPQDDPLMKKKSVFTASPLGIMRNSEEK